MKKRNLPKYNNPPNIPKRKDINDIKEILLKSIDAHRWAEKSDETHSFLEDFEKEEMVNNILINLQKNGYEIKRK